MAACALLFFLYVHLQLTGIGSKFHSVQNTDPVSVCFISTNVRAICNQLQLCITNERRLGTRKGLLYKYASFLHELWRTGSSW